MSPRSGHKRPPAIGRYRAGYLPTMHLLFALTIAAFLAACSERSHEQTTSPVQVQNFLEPSARLHSRLEESRRSASSFGL